ERFDARARRRFEGQRVYDRDLSRPPRPEVRLQRPGPGHQESPGDSLADDDEPELGRAGLVGQAGRVGRRDFLASALVAPLAVFARSEEHTSELQSPYD